MSLSYKRIFCSFKVESVLREYSEKPLRSDAMLIAAGSPLLNKRNHLL